MIKVHLQPPPQWLQGIHYWKGNLFVTADDGNADSECSSTGAPASCWACPRASTPDTTVRFPRSTVIGWSRLREQSSNKQQNKHFTTMFCFALQAAGEIFQGAPGEGRRPERTFVLEDARP